MNTVGYLWVTTDLPLTEESEGASAKRLAARRSTQRSARAIGERVTHNTYPTRLYGIRVRESGVRIGKRPKEGDNLQFVLPECVTK